tara:strand:- start:4603 stop:4779 length:177 start_codon:yes stop_codon:yes gene_type:complete
MKNEDKDELFEKIEKIKNNQFEVEYSDDDYKEKYSKDMEYMSMELDYELDRLRKRRVI